MTSTGVFELPRSDDDLTQNVRIGLTEVESRLTDTIASGDLLLDETSRHLVLAGGKRFRPTMVLLASHLGDPSAAGIVPAALVVELTHLATLYHDDVMDEATLRRGAESANERWGNSVAILTGDYLFSQASLIAADLGDEVVRIQAQTFARLVRGQIAETVGPRAGEDPVAHYLQVLVDKTGSLIATSAEFGAMLSDAPAAHREVLRRFGEKLGVAFQLADDVIDIMSDSEESGKTPGTDLREGVPTLPSLYAAGSTDPAEARLVDLLSRPLSDDAEVAEALHMLRQHPAMAQARQTVQLWAAGARDELRPLPDSAAKTAMLDLTQAVADRTT